MDKKLKRRHTQEVPNGNTFDKDLKLKRTDTQTVPNVKCYIKDSKYDKPQKNAKKINWDEDKQSIKRTDTQTIPNVKCYIKDSKFDKPQKNAKKISWEDDENEQQSIYKRWEIDSIMMPPPLPKSPPPRIYNLPHVNPCQGSPHPKKFKKTHTTNYQN